MISQVFSSLQDIYIYILLKAFPFYCIFMNIFFKKFLCRKNCSPVISSNILTAPGSYDVAKADKKIHESSPAYSLGVKHKETKSVDTPGKDATKIKTDFLFLLFYYTNIIKKIKTQFH